jgi:uncharacterized coiled-coil DUF342 family protein
MNTIETIQKKIHQLPSAAQQEVLQAIEQIEQRYQTIEAAVENNGEIPYPLDLLAEIRIDGPPDLAERHDFYAHGKLED